jgi:hypothetical protein
MDRNPFLIAAVLTALSLPSWAVHKCTMEDGKVVYQDAVCAPSSQARQTVKTWTNEGYTGARTGPTPLAAVTPNLKLTGPPGSEPLLGLYRRWADAERLALSTGRIALGGPAANLQALQREVEVLKVPECLTAAHKTLITLITKSTEAILQFMGKEELTSMVYQVVDKRKLVPEFENAIATSNCLTADATVKQGGYN